MSPARFPAVREFLASIWTPPDAYLLDAGSAAELLIARIRLGLTLGLLAIPVVNLAVAAPDQIAAHITGLRITLVAVLVSAVAYRVVHGDLRQPWLPVATSLMDVSLVSMGLAAFGLMGNPYQALNSRVTFDTYFLAIGATCLRYDVRLAIVAGAAAIVEYLLIVAWLVARFDLPAEGYDVLKYGTLAWTDQASRVILLAVQTLLCAVIVVQLQRHRRLSSSDRLTGLFNRAYFEEFLGAEVRRSKRYFRSFAVAMVDIDHFKRFNDTYGHAAGDIALRTVAGIIQREVRRSDLVARYGGEEMVIVMPETTLQAARKRLEAVREAVATEAIKVPKREERVRITVSAGVACWPADGDHPDDLQHTADARLYHAKALGRNRVVSSSVAAASV